VPVLFVCENNQYAMGTALQFTHAMKQLEKKGAAYNMESAVVDGMDVLAVEQAAKLAVKTIQRTGKPYFLVCDTYRFRAHSMFDAELYRDKIETEEWKKRDPVTQLQNILMNEKIISDNDFEEIKTRVEGEVQQAVDFAEAGTFEPVGKLEEFIYYETK